MLRRLHVRNFILIDSLDIVFPEGLVIITGQTGAGKSILLGALSLIGGGKADASNISPGADSCVVEAEYELSDSDVNVRVMLQDNDIDWNDGKLIVRRTVNSSGRSRCFVNDLPVNISVLSSLSARLIDIHSQHQSLLLVDKPFQLSMLDHFCDNGERLVSCRDLWRLCRSLETKLEQLRARMARLNADREYNQAQFDQLDKASLKKDELQDLEQEQSRLANSESIKESIAVALSAFHPYGQDTTLACGLKDAQHALEKIVTYVPAFKEISSRLDSARIELEDIMESIEVIDSGIEADPDRLEKVEDRMSMLYSLLRKHACTDISALIELKDKYSETLFDSTRLEEDFSKTDRELEDARRKYLSVCQDLHEARMSGLSEFERTVTSSLRSLELDRAIFRIELQEAQPGETGSDGIAFMFSASGINPVEVSKCASGGEISRIMLCLKQMMAHFSGMPTMIFDEIDTGVSGSVADKIGSMICSMGDEMQVFAITHLPQVAAKGKSHFVVSKSVSADGQARSSIQKLDENGRINEIARLLSGTNITAEALANAKKLLSDAD